MEEETKRFIINLARNSIENFVKTGKSLPIPEEYPEELKIKSDVFVTINKIKNGGEVLRGCIGTLGSKKSLIENILESATNATLDPRFEPLEEDELKEISVEVSILNTPQKIEVKNPKEYLEKIEPNKDGLIIKKGFQQGLFLPQVWEIIPDKYNFLSQLCLKANLSPFDWTKNGIELQKFQVEVIREKNFSERV